MAIDFSTVKAIVCPERTVYSELEYLKFNGTDNYIDTGDTPSNIYQYREITIKDVNRSTGGGYAVYFFGNGDGGTGRAVYIGIEGQGGTAPYAIRGNNGAYDEQVDLYDDYQNAPLDQEITYGIYCEDYSQPPAVFTHRTVIY